MSDKKYIVNSILINAQPSEIWDALTNPEQTKKYMFGCETVSDWQKGSDLLWKMNYEGKEIIAVKGTIASIEKDKMLAYTVIDPNSTTIADIPENYLMVTYCITKENGGHLLTVTQGNYATVADGEKRYKETYNNGEGWMPILKEIKKLVEDTNIE